MKTCILSRAADKPSIEPSPLTHEDIHVDHTPANTTHIPAILNGEWGGSISLTLSPPHDPAPPPPHPPTPRLE